MWKLGLWPSNSYSGNICLEFSVLVLCSAVTTVETLPPPFLNPIYFLYNGLSVIYKLSHENNYRTQNGGGGGEGLGEVLNKRETAWLP
jgi:hypothetical protein